MKRNHSIEKRRQKMMGILLRSVAIVHHSALSLGEVRVVDTKQERVTRLDEYQATAIAHRAHPWAVLFCVMTDNGQMHQSIANADRPINQADMVATLEEQHQQLLARVKTIIALEGNGVQVHSFGWIAMPVQHDIEEQKAERVFAVALRTMRKAA